MSNRTLEAIKNQIRAMDCHTYDIGLREQATGKFMIRNMTQEQVLDAVPWLKNMNAKGNDIYIRPGRDENRALILVDDIDGIIVERMRDRGVGPALVVETSPKNLQVWISLGTEPMPENERAKVAKAFAAEFGGDVSSADATHFGRLAGFTNRKPEHLTENGYPYVLCRDSRGYLAEKSEHIRLWAMFAKLPKDQTPPSANTVNTANPNTAFKAYFEEWSRYQWEKIDMSKGDFAAASRMAKEGYTKADIETAILNCSPDLSTRKKWHMEDYARRTAVAACTPTQTKSQTPT